MGDYGNEGRESGNKKEKFKLRDCFRAGQSLQENPQDAVVSF